MTNSVLIPSRDRYATLPQQQCERSQLGRKSWTQESSPNSSRSSDLTDESSFRGLRPESSRWYGLYPLIVRYFRTAGLLGRGFPSEMKGLLNSTSSKPVRSKDVTRSHQSSWPRLLPGTLNSYKAQFRKFGTWYPKIFEFTLCSEESAGIRASVGSELGHKLCS